MKTREHVVKNGNDAEINCLQGMEHRCVNFGAYVRQKTNEAVLGAIECNLILLGESAELSKVSDLNGDIRKEDFALIRLFLENGFISPEELKESVRKGVCRMGQKMYDQVMRGGYPDHVTSPQALAFVMSWQVLTPTQIAEVAKRIDHGKTLHQFMARADGLLEDIVEQILGEAESMSKRSAVTV